MVRDLNLESLFVRQLRDLFPMKYCWVRVGHQREVNSLECSEESFHGDGQVGGAAAEKIVGIWRCWRTALALVVLWLRQLSRRSRCVSLKSGMWNLRFLSSLIKNALTELSLLFPSKNWKKIRPSLTTARMIESPLMSVLKCLSGPQILSTKLWLMLVVPENSLSSNLMMMIFLVSRTGSVWRANSFLSLIFFSVFIQVPWCLIFSQLRHISSYNILRS